MSNNTETVESNLKTLQDNLNQIEKSFNKLREDINSKLVECSHCIKTAKESCHEPTKMNTDLGNTFAGVSNEEKEWNNIKLKLATTSVRGMVTLNVGGEKYVTSVDTLTRVKGSFFTALFSEQWTLERHPVDESIFIDRNGKIFPYVLEYLRTGMLPYSVWKEETILHSLLAEAQYFHLYSLTKLLREGYFSNGTLLQIEYQIKLNEFYGKAYQRWDLIYKGSRDGFDAQAFHAHCDNQGPTMTIIQTNNNYLFGGYTAVPWTSSQDGSYQKDTTASLSFLFTLTNPHDISPTKYFIRSDRIQNAVYHKIDFGPTFGSGHDIYVANNCNSNSSSINFPYTYTDTTGKDNGTFTGSRYFTIYDIEVFKPV